MKEGSLAELNPNKDGHGLLRIYELFGLADEHAYGTRHPILLPKNHHVTTLIVVDTYDRLCHGSGMEYVQTELKSRFFFIKGRRVMRNITPETCAECRRRFTTKIGSWTMAHPNQDGVGVDYGGQFFTRYAIKNKSCQDKSQTSALSF